MQGLRGVGRDFKVQMGLLYCIVVSVVILESIVLLQSC